MSETRATQVADPEQIEPHPNMGAQLIDPALGTIAGERVQLWGSRCPECGTVTFPKQGSCPRCTAGGMERCELPSEGTLWSWTVQGFPPKSPPYAGSAGDFEPYGVGYVELGGELRVEGILTTADPDELRIGMSMRAVAWPVPGRPGIVTYAFTPRTRADG
jgi:uncharacterized OB-fold protein